MQFRCLVFKAGKKKIHLNAETMGSAAALIGMNVEENA